MFVLIKVQRTQSSPFVIFQDSSSRVHFNVVCVTINVLIHSKYNCNKTYDGTNKTNFTKNNMRVLNQVFVP